MAWSRYQESRQKNRNVKQTFYNESSIYQKIIEF